MGGLQPGRRSQPGHLASAFTQLGAEETAKTWDRVTLCRRLERGQQMPRLSTRVGSWESASSKRSLRVWNSPHTAPPPLLSPIPPPCAAGRHRWPAVLLCYEGTGRGSGWAPSAEPRAGRPRPAHTSGRRVRPSGLGEGAETGLAHVEGHCRLCSGTLS